MKILFTKVSIYQISQESKEELSAFILDIKEINTVFKCGNVGKIKILSELSIQELNEVYSLNVYANKEILDILMNIKVKNIIVISSGASKMATKVGVHIAYQKQV